MRKGTSDTMIQVNTLLRPRRSLGLVRRFATVGLLCTLVDVMLFSVLHGLAGLPALAANTLSYSAGIVVSFLLHRRWTFAQRPRKALGAQFSQFAAVSLSALLVNNLIVLGLSPVFGALLGNATLGAIAAKLCATAVGLCWNFLINTTWTFRDSREAERA